MVRVGESVDRLVAVVVAETGDTVPALVDQTAWFRCGGCGHEVTIRATY